MEHILILLAMGLLLNVFNKLNAELNVIPRDTEVMVNDSTYMNCSTSLDADKVQWRHGNDYVYAGRSILEPYNMRFSVEINSSTGTNNLVIRSVEPSDAGQYECSEDEGSGERRSAQLIVLDGDPVCTSSMHSRGVIGPNMCGIEQENVKFSCSITYNGNIFPVLQWKARGDNQSIIEGLSNLTSTKNDITYTLTMKSTLDLNNSSFICQTTRTSNRNYSCSSDVIKILYVFSSNVTINMTMDEEVSCFANTSQSCSYKWKWFRAEDLSTESNDQTLKPNRVGWHRCEATCPIGNKSCTVEPMYAEVYSTVAHRGQNLLALLVLFALPAIVIIGVVICRWRKNQQELMERNRQQEQQRLIESEFERKREKYRKRQKEERQRTRMELGEEFGRKRDEERQRLIDTLPEKYKSDPVLVQTIKTKAAERGKKFIKGLTILDQELFVVKKRDSEVEVYDSMKFSFSRRMNLTDLTDPKDLVSCNRNKCLYLSDQKGHGQSSEILRVDPNGKLTAKWSTGDGYGRLSVTNESNVILAVSKRVKLNEYSPDGQLISEINLSGSGIHNPLHAIKLTNGHFVVSHGYEPDDLHRVCEVDAGGNLKKSFGEKCGSITREMDLPVYLAVDGNGFVMVADRWNRRVLLLDSDLKFKRSFRSNDYYRFRLPTRILLDQINDRLFMADKKSDDHSILILEFTK